MTKARNPVKASDAFKEAAQRVTSGQSTKEVEAAALNIKPGTFAVWMTRAGLTSRRNPDGSKKLHGAALGWVTTDPDKAKALEAATALVLAGETSATQAAEKFPGVAVSAISARVRRARTEAGVEKPPTIRRTRAQMEAARAAQSNQQV